MSAITNEKEYIDNYLKELSLRSVRYGQDYLARSLPSPLRIKRQPVNKQPKETPVTISATETSDESQSTATNDNLEIIIKTLKPASQFPITRLSLDDTVFSLKQRIYQQKTIPAKQQRLLLKGKVLNDDKKLSDYNLTKDTCLHLMINKPASTPSSSAVDTANISSSADREVKNERVLSNQAKAILKEDSFWTSLEQTLGDQLDAADAQLVLQTWKKALSD